MKRTRQVSITTRTREMYATAKRRAGGTVPYTLDELRARYEKRLRSHPFCGYCRATIGPANVSLDHLTPVARGGRHDLTNVDFICVADNKAKGNMTAFEYKRLLSALDEIGVECRNPSFRNEVVGALRAANSFRIGANRRAKRAACDRVDALGVK